MRSEDLGLLLVSAVRYALGRQTYIVAETCRIVRQEWSAAPGASIETIRRDIRNALELSALSGIDEPEWRTLLSDISDETAQRRSTEP